MKKVALCLLLLASSSTALRSAQEANPTQPPSLIAGVNRLTYSNLRVGDVAPEFTLPALGGKLWSSREQLGKNAVLLLLVGESPVLIAKGATPQGITQAIAETARQLSTRNVATVAVSQSTGISLQGLSQEFDALTLKDEKAELAQLFKPDPTTITLVAIDRAGFLRHIEALHPLAAIRERMLQAGDCTPALEVGKPAPDFSIPDMHGQVRRLSELRGRKNLLLTFFPKCFTGGCANHLTSLQQEKASLDSSDTEVWAVSVDPAQGERGQLAFASQLGVAFDFIPDTGRNLSLLYEAARRPHSTAWRRTMLIDRDGIVRLIDKQVNVYTHGPDMTAKLKELNMVKANNSRVSTHKVEQ
jgi:peroxiredoxin